tara:strand:+ start:688 stop:906 length:219 start_codon:yes stop_codon:yes gene_type:complete
MKLKEYLINNSMTQKDFIQEIQTKHNKKIPQGTLAKWILGIRIPRKDDMLKIYETTNRKVTPNDFFLDGADN